MTAATYLPSGPLSSVILGNGLTEARSFTNRYFPSSITLGGTGNLLSWTYTTDKVGNIKTIADALNAANNRTYNYQDFHYFLTQGDGPWGPRSWTYDKIGNRLTENRGGVTDTYAYGSSTGGGHTPILTQIQLGSGGTRTYQFGPAGHLEKVATGSDATLFTNDAAGHLAALERTPLHTGTAFRYDGRGYLTLADASALPFLDGFETGNVCAWSAALGLTATPTCTAPLPSAVHPTYSSEGLLHALQRNTTPDRSLLFHFEGRPVAQLDLTGTVGTWRYLTTDHLGTPIAATSTAGALQWQGGFEPFGTDWSGAGGAGVFLRFPGQWEEGAWSGVRNDLYYNVNRWYDSPIGRYTTADPLVSLSALAAYRYGLSNPVRYQDRTGLQAAPLPLPPPESFPPLRPVPPPTCSPVPEGIPWLGAAGAALTVIFKELFDPTPLGGPGVDDFTDPSCKPKCGDCDPLEHGFLQAAVERACKGVPRSCTAAMGWNQLEANFWKNVECYYARREVNARCFRGGDSGHQTAAKDTLNAAIRCLKILTEPNR